MKVGGNDSATKFFQQNGGSAALNSKDSKTKYQSTAATKYKDELKRRAARDAREYVTYCPLPLFFCYAFLLTRPRFPNEVVINDSEGTEGTTTPAGEPTDDFFASWDKPAIKKPTPPVSRTATPPVVGRTPSPFLNAGANKDGVARVGSPLSSVAMTGDDAKPATSRITHSSALKKTTTGPRKTNILGAKKATSKLGVKKVTGEIIDFDEAEKKAKEEAERIEKLGYNPDDDDEASTTVKSGSAKADIVSPTPVVPARSGYGSASHTREKSASEMERLGMGISRLGFGQVGGRPGTGAAAAAAKKNGGGFGSVGPIKADIGMFFFLLGVFFISLGLLLLINLQTKTKSLLGPSLARKRPSPLMSTLARAFLTPTRSRRLSRGCRALTARQLYLPTPTLADRRKKLSRTMAISSRLPRILCGGSASRQAMIWRT